MQITLDFVYVNVNPRHVFDCTDRELEKRLRLVGIANAKATVPLSIENHTGFIHESFISSWDQFDVKVKARELGEGGKPLNLFERLRYLLTGRYWR